MDDYIDRKAAIKLLTSVGLEVSDSKRRTVAKCINEIELMPAADVAPVVHGRWLDNRADGYKWAFICSRCGYVDGHPFGDRHNFCPNCGAKMENDEDGGKNHDD
mgnify:CR=1 FL=1